MSTTVIPAQAGWHLAIFIETGEYQGAFDCIPIIAWAIVEDTGDREGDIVLFTTTPITVDMSPPSRNGNPWVIKSPEGKYIFPDDTSCDNERDALQFCIEREKRRHKKQVSKPRAQTNAQTP
jgi:hypothetical protein